jgi:flagellar biosynthesis/type III secretory pathway protein FliH
MKKTKKKQDNLISMSAYAKKRDVSYELIRRYCKEKRITLFDGKINPDIADQELAEGIQPNGNSKLDKKEVTTAGHMKDFNKAKARRETYKADLANLELQEKIGKLISVEQVQKEAEDLYRKYRDQMLNVVIRATKKLLGEDNEFKFRKVLKKEIEDAIKKIE